ncbi:MAG TPA: hypothetical protein PLS46_09730 [Microthrixaceae bacterium]|nr:hypothetical protein [Microthrixaceae bacterium]
MSGKASDPRAKVPRQTAAEARAEAQAAAAAGKAARDAAIAERFGEGVPGAGILSATKVTTALFVVFTVVVTIVDTRGLRIALALFDSALFLAGCGLFLLPSTTARSAVARPT